MTQPMDVSEVAGELAVMEDGTYHETPSTGRARRKLGVGFWLAVAWIAFVFFGAVFAPWLGLQPPNDTSACSKYANVMVNTGATPEQAFVIYVGKATGPQQAQAFIDAGGKVPVDPTCPNPTLDDRTSAYPSSLHWLGTDSLGRDMLSRLIYGGRVALTVGVVSIAVAMLVGGTIGLLAGFYRGRTETGLMIFVDILLAYPALVLALAIVAIRGASLFNVCFAVAVVATPAFARIARGATLTFSEREFVTASRVMGAKNRRIVLREILPNSILPVTAFALVAVAIAIVAEGGLAFLGLSVQPPAASWGSMIKDGYNVITDRPLVAILPAIWMFLTVLSFNVLGDRFRTFFDVKESAL